MKQLRLTVATIAGSAFIAASVHCRWCHQRLSRTKYYDQNIDEFLHSQGHFDILMFEQNGYS